MTRGAGPQREQSVATVEGGLLLQAIPRLLPPLPQLTLMNVDQEHQKAVGKGTSAIN